jgi:hypothetical protein
VKRSGALGFRRFGPRSESASRYTSNHCDTRYPVAQVWPKATSPRPFWLVEAVEVEPQSHPVIAVAVHDFDRVRQRLTRSQVAAGVDASFRMKTSIVTHARVAPYVFSEPCLCVLLHRSRRRSRRCATLCRLKEVVVPLPHGTTK